MHSRVQTPRGSASSRARRPAVWIIVALTLLGGLLLPALPIVLGVLLVVAALLDAMAPGLRPATRALLRMRQVQAGKQRARLALAVGTGILLVVTGTVGAMARGRVRSEIEQRASRQQSDRDHVATLLERAREHLTAGELAGAERALMDAQAIVTDTTHRREVEDLLGRLRRSGDADAILDILTGLPQHEFEALASGTSVPAPLDFRDRALTTRAVELALSQLDVARRARTRY